MQTESWQFLFHFKKYYTLILRHRAQCNIFEQLKICRWVFFRGNKRHLQLPYPLFWMVKSCTLSIHFRIQRKGLCKFNFPRKKCSSSHSDSSPVHISYVKVRLCGGREIIRHRFFKQYLNCYPWVKTAHRLRAISVTSYMSDSCNWLLARELESLRFGTRHRKTLSWFKVESRKV
jgi:hypothetical protein